MLRKVKFQMKQPMFIFMKKSAPERGEVMPCFDYGHYCNPYSFSGDGRQSALEHYLTVGWRECRNPSAEFDTVFYYMSVSGLTHPEMCPLEHYSNADGKAPRNREEALAAGLPLPDMDQLVANLPDLCEFFDAEYYVSRYPDVMCSDVPPLRHFLRDGWKDGRNPSERFETLFYRKRFMHNDAADVCPLVHYLRFGRLAALPTTAAEARVRAIKVRAGGRDPVEAALPSLSRIVAAALAAPRFSASFYVSSHADIAQAKVDPYWHYSVAGWKEGRSPLPKFDARWYSSRFMNGELGQSVSPLLHMATVGRLAELPLNPNLEHSVLEQTLDAVWSDQLCELLHQIGIDGSLLHRDKIRRVLLPMFSVEDYRTNTKVGDGISNAAAFLRYLTVDLQGGLPPGPMFSASHYLQEIERLHLPKLKVGESPFLHWLTVGLPAGASPNPAFVQETYLGLNNDLKDYTDLPLYHFLQHGIEEERRFSKLTVIARSPAAHLRSGAGSSIKEFLSVVARSSEESDEFIKMQNFLSSGRLREIVRAACELEPDVGSLQEDMLSMVPPWHDAAWHAYSDILKLLPQGTFDCLVLIPFCKLGGADFVAGVLASELAQTRRTIVIRTDAEDWERPDWFAPDVETLDLSKYLAAFSPAMRKRALYCLILRLGVKDVFNVNSRLAFETFETFGERLAISTRLHTYYFCADRTEDGIEAGYPVWYFSKLLPFLSTAMIDNTPLAKQLIERFGLSGPLRDRLKVFFTPAMTGEGAEVIVEHQVATAAMRRRRRVLWAGRFDRQKRFDLLVEIARLMPEVDFVAWGKAVLDSPPDLSDLPENLSVQKPFKNYEDLPLADSDGWLYTSAWDGIPTILVELGARAVPIVATTAGGVSDVISETTGWPVPIDGDALAYVAALQDMLASPEEKVKRAVVLSNLIRSRHSRTAFSAALEEAIGPAGEGKHG